jgi:hypothetical protein
MKITKEQLLTLEADGIGYIREWFPEAFEKQNGWYTDKEYPKWFGYFIEDKLCYGFNTDGHYFKEEIPIDDSEKSNDIKATPEQVETALTNEAVMRGFKEGVWLESLIVGNGDVKCCDNHSILDKDGSFWIGGSCVMKDGIWAEIIPTITKEEAEKKLNCKII